MSRNRRFEECVAIALKHEGGFVDHPRDPGGATNMGITLRTLREWRGDESLTADAVRMLTEAEAREIYLARYWNPVRGDELPPGVDLAVFDYAVHSGVRRAVRDLQAVVGTEPDGAMGRRTLAAVRDMDAATIVVNLSDHRRAFLRRLPHFSDFGRGWLRRVAEIETAALKRTSCTPMTLSEAQHTDTVQVATQVVTVAAPVAAGVPAMVQALGGLDPAVGVALVAAGLVLVVVGAWLGASWLRARRV
jgi:lysozyme family protein